jgi:sulfatase maturation enzyme AslB (radical SAM superfamily)
MVAREGDGSHALGTVDSTYKELTTSPKARSIVADSLLEAHPVCNKCAFMPFCGANPIDNFRNNHQYYSLWPSERHCRKTKAIVSFIIEKMHNADDGEREVFLSWIGRNSVREFEGIA